MPHRGRTDTAFRIVRAAPATIYRAFVDPQALASWLPPDGMTGWIERFEPHAGGRYRMILSYEAPDHPVPGKSTDHADIVEGCFLELVPARRIVQLAEFDSSDPAFAEPMTITWSLEPVPEGTHVTVTCENVPAAVRPEDHDAGLRSSLANLAAFVE